MLKISIIIPYYKPLNYLKKCLAALHGNTIHPIHEVILVNDGAPDSDALREFMSLVENRLNFKLRFIDRQENHGFVYTCNEGARHAGGDYLLFLNFDTIPQGGWLTALVTLLNRQPNCGILGSRLLFPGVNLIQHVGGAFDKNGNPCHIYKGQPAFLPFLTKDRLLQWVTGAALMISKADFNAVNGFDPEFVSSSEDLDLCFKVRFQLGKEIWMAAHSILYHYTDVTGASSQHIARTHPLFITRWKEKIVRDVEAIYEADGFVPGLSADSAPPFPVDQEENPQQSGSLDRFHIQQLVGTLSNPALTAAEKKPLFEQLTAKLDAMHILTILYNLASMLAINEKREDAVTLFSFLAALVEESNPPLAGKAIFKLSELNQDTEEKKKYLAHALQLYPQHNLARKTLALLELKNER